jgi:hypothetical protein
MSFRASGSGLPRHRSFATAAPVIDAFGAPGLSCENRGAWVPVHASPCQGKPRFSEPRHRSPTSATVSTRGHTLRAIDPRARVRLSPRYSPAPTGAGCVDLTGALPHRGPASRDPRAAAFAVAFPLAWKGAEHGPEHSSKGERALLTMSRVPFSWHSGHPGHRLESPPGLDDLAAPRTGLDPSWMQPRERPHRRENRGAFRPDETLTRAKDCSFVRARTATPSRGLRGGVARELARLCYRVGGALF